MINLFKYSWKRCNLAMEHYTVNLVTDIFSSTNPTGKNKKKTFRKSANASKNCLYWITVHHNQFETSLCTWSPIGRETYALIYPYQIRRFTDSCGFRRFEFIPRRAKEHVLILFFELYQIFGVLESILFFVPFRFASSFLIIPARSLSVSVSFNKPLIYMISARDKSKIIHWLGLFSCLFCY